LARRLLHPRDTWERHVIVARAVERPGSVLDVGGRPGELAGFLPGSAVTALNVDEPADVVVDGARLPFDDEAFDVVTSLDVLEHLPHERRRSHLEELVRVARRQVVVCCPLGTTAHMEAERELALWYRSETGRPHRFLEEHLAHGLPSEAELRELVRDLPFRFELAFQGDFRRTNEVFRASVQKRLVRYGRELLRPADAKLAAAPTGVTNRAFLYGAPRHAP
jgi:Methyltransferase domain